jgi:hypothetical protein
MTMFDYMPHSSLSHVLLGWSVSVVPHLSKGQILHAWWLFHHLVALLVQRSFPELQTMELHRSGCAHAHPKLSSLELPPLYHI